MGSLIKIDNYGIGKINAYFSYIDNTITNNIHNILGKDIDIQKEY